FTSLNKKSLLSLPIEFVKIDDLKLVKWSIRKKLAFSEKDIISSAILNGNTKIMSWLRKIIKGQTLDASIRILINHTNYEISAFDNEILINLVITKKFQMLEYLQKYNIRLWITIFFIAVMNNVFDIIKWQKKKGYFKTIRKYELCQAIWIAKDNGFLE